MDEQFLYYIWGNRLTKGELRTSDGSNITIVNTGYRNSDSGPDFKEAKIKIGDTLWGGNVEIHVKTSDWNKHRHQYDNAYKNVILHVVYENDTTVNEIPVLELKSHFDENLFANYHRFISSKRELACANSIGFIQKYTWLSWLDSLIVERLQDKSNTTSKILNNNKFDWEDAFYRLLLHYMGMKVNNDAFGLLANVLPFKVLQKHADNLTQVEAMLFGCAGMLNEKCIDDYTTLLLREFRIMQAKFNLKTMPNTMWKYMRMRPGNFPTVRIAQIAQIIHTNSSTFSKILNSNNIKEIRQIFDVKASSYWETHYRFGVVSPKREKHLGAITTDTLIVNAVTPLLFAWGKRHEEPDNCDKAIAFLEELDAENNKITRLFASQGCSPQNAMQSQAMLSLYENYCKKHRCLECSIGNVLIKTNNKGN